MKARKCIHPIKANRIIAEFANSVALPPVIKEYELETSDGYCFGILNCSDIQVFIQNHEKSGLSKIIHYEYKEFQPYFEIIRSTDRNSMNFSVETMPNENNCYEITVPCWNTALKNDDDIGGKYFRRDFTKRCPLAKGFADVTISILHEIGHRMTEDLIPADFDRSTQEIDNLFEAEDEEDFHNLYFKMPDETLATNWAIEWLQNPENRKKAKAFEKKFFACFE